MSHLSSHTRQIAKLSDMREELMSCLQSAVDSACSYRESFTRHAYLWEDDRQVFLQQFLLYDRVLTTEEIEAAGKIIGLLI